MELQSIVLLITLGPVSVQNSIHQCWVMFRRGRGASSSQSEGENLTCDQSEARREAEMNAGECYADHYHSRFQDSFTLFVTRWEKQKPSIRVPHMACIEFLYNQL